MGVYNKDGEIRLIGAMFEGAQWELQDGVLITAIIELVGAAEVLEHLDADEVLEWLGDNKEPQKVFTYDELEVWALDNDFVSAANLDYEDPPGYEERERY